jgi:hypothetical protein
MIIAPEEVTELEKFLMSDPNGGFGFEFFATRPHLLLPLGFDQYRCLKGGESFPGPWTHHRDERPQSFYRKPTGQWCWMFGVFPILQRITFGIGGGPFSDDEVFGYNRMFIGGQMIPSCAFIDGRNEKLGVENVGYDELMGKVTGVASNPDQVSISTIWSGTLWTPQAQEEQRLLLESSTVDLLRSIKSEKMTLADLSWRQLEDIVVEILRKSGMEIHKVTETPQGGRDVIARTWMLGEPVTLAVEVKHRDVVEPGHVRDALYASQHFNGLLFVTSGRFSSGVLRERDLLGNQLRLILKDGVALGDLIREYPLAPPT